MAVDLTTEIDISEVLEVAKNYPGTVTKILKKIGLLTQAELAREAPVNHGYLAGSIEKPRVVAEDVVSIHIGANYWTYVAFGTGLHGPHRQPFDIYPKTAKVLRFSVGGTTVFARYVKDHPGMQANPFVDRAFDTVETQIEGVVSHFLKEIL